MHVNSCPHVSPENLLTLSLSLVQAAHEICASVGLLNCPRILSLVRDLQGSSFESLYWQSVIDSRQHMIHERTYIRQDIHRLLFVKKLKHSLSQAVEEQCLCPEVHRLGVCS